LVGALGQDAVQSILSEAFRPHRTELQSREPENSQTESTESSEGAAASTVEALMYALRTNGNAALATAANRMRLAELSDLQVREVFVRLRRIQSEYPSITDELRDLLVELLP